MTDAKLTRLILQVEQDLADLLQVPGDLALLALDTATSHLRHLLRLRAERDLARAESAKERLVAELRPRLREDGTFFAKNEKTLQVALGVAEDLAEAAAKELRSLAARDDAARTMDLESAATEAERRCVLGVFHPLHG